jgi:phage portal protein BeeE
MGLISRLGAFARAVPNVWRRRAQPTPRPTLCSGATSSGRCRRPLAVEINQQTALGAVSVMACVMMLTEDLAKLPVSLYRLRADSSREQVADHPLALLLLEEPNES